MMEIPSPIAGFGLALAETPGAEFGRRDCDRHGNTGRGRSVDSNGADRELEREAQRGWQQPVATKLAVAPVGLLMVTIGSPALIICVHANGPASGKLPCEFNDTSVPAMIGVTGAL